MRQIEPSLTELVKIAIKDMRVAEADAVDISSYRELVEEIAKLSYLNKDYLLFFRGQDSDYRNKAGASTFYPSIYRGDYLPKKEVRHRFDILNGASRLCISSENYRPSANAKSIYWKTTAIPDVCPSPMLRSATSVTTCWK